MNFSANQSFVISLVLLVSISATRADDTPRCPMSDDWKQNPTECPCKKNWRPSPEQLDEILRIHQNWIGLGADPKKTGKAILCNANLQGAEFTSFSAMMADFRHVNLSRAKLEYADLSHAELQNARLEQANLSSSNLSGAKLEDADLTQSSLARSNLSGTNLSRAKLVRASLNDADLTNAILSAANLRYTALSGAVLKGADLKGTDLTGASLRGVNLSRLHFEKAILSKADLKGTDLTGALLNEAHLEDVNLENAVLVRAVLENAVLSNANLQGANLLGANLRNASLERANLSGAKLKGAVVHKAQLASAILTQATYSPSSEPPNDYLENIVGLDSVMFPHGGQSGLVMLRTLLQKTGLRDLERKATYAIERNKARWERQTPESLAERFDGWAKLVFFEWTTDYGLQPSRAFVILLGIVVILSTVYTVPIAASPTHSSNAHGVFRVWPAERIELNGKNVRVANDARVERLTAGIPAVFGWALYFSLLSAFHIGWRELNVGSWISRIQPREFVLRGQGWVRMISGIQSIISLYLIAIWALTYFGRPFE